MRMAIMRVRDKNGNTVEIPAIQGEPGYTPVKGVDYFTDEEVAQIVNRAVEEAVSVCNAPTLLIQNTWYKGTTAKTVITEIHVVDTYTETGAEAESWNADTEDLGKIKCYIDGTTLIIAGNGSGRIMANADASKLFVSLTGVSTISGLELLDTRNVRTFKNAFANMSSLTSLSGYEGWNVSKCTQFMQIFGSDPLLTSLDLSAWDVSAAVAAAKSEGDVDALTNTAMKYMFNSCFALERLRLNKSFDLNYTHLPVPEGNDDGAWVDADTGLIYSDVDGNSIIVPEGDGLPNPCVEGRTITFEAVFPEAEVTV